MIQPVLQPQQPPKRTILTVSQLNRQSKNLLESNLGSVWLTGEISNLTKAVSGHWYFSLKDNSAQIRCAMFQFKVKNIQFSPKEGDKVVLKGKVSLYEARGDYQLIADYMEPAGLGNLQQKLNALMEKFKAQGLFDPKRKQPLPEFPKTIGVITSTKGAAIYDVLTVLERRSPMTSVIIYPTQVQGVQATQNIINALEQAELRHECDALLITRGGGSLEDLWCFNDEVLALKIVHAKIPIVAAIGHEVDVTLCELVADLRAPTPSAAAELLVPEQTTLYQKIDHLNSQMIKQLNGMLNQLQTQLNTAHLKLVDPANTITNSQLALSNIKQRLLLQMVQFKNNQQRKLDHLLVKLLSANPQIKLEQNAKTINQLQTRLNAAWQQQFNKKTHQLHLQAQTLHTLSPLATLGRGYAILRDSKTNQVLSSVDQMMENQNIKIMVFDGEAEAKIKNITHKKNGSE